MQHFVAFAFYRAMLRKARYCYGKSSVCPSVCLSGHVTDKWVCVIVRFPITNSVMS